MRHKTLHVQSIQQEFRYRTVPAEQEGISPYIGIIRFGLDFLDENEALVQSVVESSAFPLLLDLVSEQIIRDVKERFEKDQAEGKELLLSPELMAYSYTGALLQILRWWLAHREQMSKEEVVDQMQKVFDKLYAV